METLFGMLHFNVSDTTMILRQMLWFIVYPATHKKCFLQESWKSYRAHCGSARLDLQSGTKMVKQLSGDNLMRCANIAMYRALSSKFYTLRRQKLYYI
jgi:hypothetical protein